MTKLKISSLLMCTAALATGCSIVSPRNNGPKPEVRDVPFAARGDDQGLRKRVMVLPFIDGLTGRVTTASNVARDAFVNAMRGSGDYVFVPTTDFPKDITTYIKNGKYELEAMGKIGGGIGLATIIEGKILEIRAKRIGDEVGIVRQVKARIDATVQVRMVNAKNGVVIFDETRSATTEEVVTRVAERADTDRYLQNDPQLVDAVITKAFQASIPRIAQTIEKLSWEGRVALVKGERIYVNAGRVSGIQVGDILKITEDGEDIYDPETGALIGRVPGRLKGTVEVVSYFGKDGSVAVIHSGSGFRENDKIELY